MLSSLFSLIKANLLSKYRVLSPSIIQPPKAIKSYVACHPDAFNCIEAEHPTSLPGPGPGPGSRRFSDPARWIAYIAFLLFFISLYMFASIP